MANYWVLSKDGNPDALGIMKRHYSWHEYKDGRPHKLFVGPGNKMVLLLKDKNGLFVWRKFISKDGQQGINCAVFRNESLVKSSDLILEAEQLAWKRWPNARFYTYVNSKKILSKNPGYCFIMAGWKKCGITKCNKLIILEKIPMDLEFSGLGGLFGINSSPFIASTKRSMISLTTFTSPSISSSV